MSWMSLPLELRVKIRRYSVVLEWIDVERTRIETNEKHWSEAYDNALHYKNDRHGVGWISANYKLKRYNERVANRWMMEQMNTEIIKSAKRHDALRRRARDFRFDQW
jgi:2-oxoglutarate dehydrogenase complex dehydrogenase (E1) component-like enzyme